MEGRQGVTSPCPYGAATPRAGLVQLSSRSRRGAQGQSRRVGVHARHAPRTGAGTRRRCEARRHRSAGLDRTSRRPARLAKHMALRAMTLLHAPCAAHPPPTAASASAPSHDQPTNQSSQPAKPATQASQPAPNQHLDRRGVGAGGGLAGRSIIVLFCRSASRCGP